METYKKVSVTSEEKLEVYSEGWGISLMTNDDIEEKILSDEEFMTLRLTMTTNRHNKWTVIKHCDATDHVALLTWFDAETGRTSKKFFHDNKVIEDLITKFNRPPAERRPIKHIDVNMLDEEGNN
jgi:hypothetical protein